MDETQSLSSDGTEAVAKPSPEAAPWPEAAAHWLETLPEGSARIGRFTVLERIGAGGVGMVFAAYDSDLDRKVALKVLREQVTSGSSHVRIVREARAMAKLSHPNVAQVFEVGEHLGSTFVAMEFVRGVTLRQWQEQAERSWREVLAVYVQAGRGLAAAHAEGLVHRDFKPDNAMIGRDGRVRVLDFGLVRAEERETSLGDESGGGRPTPTAGASSSMLTKDGALMGTPGYMSAEQWLGEPADHRSDQFGFCVAVWEALLGERPFAGSTRVELVANVLAGRLGEGSSDRKVPGWVRAVLVRGLSVAPAERFPSMDALLAALEADPSRRRRRGLAVGAGVAAIALGIGGYTLDRARRVQACEDEAASIAEVWNDEVREQAKASLLGSGVGFAPSTWERVEPRLDAYAAAWSEVRESTCLAEVEGTRNPELAMRTSECLSEHRDTLEAFVDTLVEDSTVVYGAALAAEDLPVLEDCTDEARLERRMPPPGDPEVRARVSVLRGRLNQAHEVAALGRAANGLARARELVVEAEAVGWVPLQAEVLLLEGQLAVLAGELGPAERALEQALEHALRGGHDVVAAEAMAYLAGTVGGDLARPQHGLWWGRLALMFTDRLGGEEDLHLATALGFMASAHGRSGEYAEAKSLLERSLRISESVLGPDHPRMANTLDTLATSHYLLGEFAQAMPIVERALSIREATLGPDHPAVADTLDVLGAVHYELGAYGEARALHERTLALRERGLGPRHVEVAGALVNLARDQRALNAFDETRRLLERALAIMEDALGPDHPNIAIVLTNLGSLEYASGAYAAAEANLTRGIEIQERALGPDHPDVGRSVSLLADVRMEQGARAEAMVLLERALAIQEKGLGLEHVEVADTLHSLGTLHMMAGAHALAKPPFERALAIRQAALGAEHRDVAQSLLGLGMLHHAMGRHADARPLLERSLAAYEKALGSDDPTVAHPLVSLAETALAQGAVTEAVSLAERAVALREVEKRRAKPLAGARFVLAKALLAAGRDHAHARTLAEQARDGYREDGFSAKELAEVETWLAQHRRELAVQ